MATRYQFDTTKFYSGLETTNFKHGILLRYCLLNMMNKKNYCLFPIAFYKHNLDIHNLMKKKSVFFLYLFNCLFIPGIPIHIQYIVSFDHRYPIVCPEFVYKYQKIIVNKIPIRVHKFYIMI